MRIEVRFGADGGPVGSGLPMIGGGNVEEMSTLVRFLRSILAIGCIPLAAWVAYAVARYVDGQPATIDTSGSVVGVLMVIASVFAASRITSDQDWSERAAISLGLSAAFFLLSWVQFGDPSASIDESPHVVWYAVCVAVFAPVAVIISGAQWAWETLRIKRSHAYDNPH